MVFSYVSVLFLYYSLFTVAFVIGCTGGRIRYTREFRDMKT